MFSGNKTVIVLGSLLFLSLAGNLFMGGVLLGKGYGPHGKHAEWEKRDRELKEKLSEQDRAILKESMTANRDRFKELKEKREAARDKVGAAIDAEPFDQQALDEALKAEQQVKMELLTAMRDAKKSAMEKLSPEGRAVLEKMGGEKRSHFRKWRGDRGMDGMFGGGFERRRSPEEGRPEPVPPSEP